MFWECIEFIDKKYKRVRQLIFVDTSKKRAEQFGRIAETIAVLFLRMKLYTILARRYRNRAGEIDIIAIRNKTIAFVEVKARRGYGGSEVLATEQQKRIMAAAELFMSNKPFYAGHMMRFDLMMIGTSHLPIHIADAWRRS